MREEIKYKEHTIIITPDEDPLSPYEDNDNDDRFLVFKHRDFTVTKKYFDPVELFEIWKKANIYDGYWLFGVEAYIHSGVALALKGSIQAARFPDRRWDVSFGGFVLVKRMKGWSWQMEKARGIAEKYIEFWNNYLSGNVYQFEIPSLKEEVNGNWYGDWRENALPEAKRIIDALTNPELC